MTNKANAGSGGKVDFGFESVAVAEKAARVADVFRSVAGRYDVMNDLMSLGTHRVMKHMTMEFARLREGNVVLDVAGGTGDMTRLVAPRVGRSGRVVLTDINDAMLSVGRDRLLDAGIVGNVDFAIADAEQLPFADASFDQVVIAFGLRNVTTKERALASFHRVLKPGGRLLVLEFSKPPFAPMRDAFSLYTRLWPALGKLVVDDADSYRYLRESIEMHPDQPTLAGMVEDAGFRRCRYNNLLGGVVALHRADRAA